MNNVVNIPDLARSRMETGEPDGCYEGFLISEGLVLLATYRSIRDEDLRRKVQVYTEDMARLDAAARRVTPPARSRQDGKSEPGPGGPAAGHGPSDARSKSQASQDDGVAVACAREGAHEDRG